MFVILMCGVVYGEKEMKKSIRWVAGKRRGSCGCEKYYDQPCSYERDSYLTNIASIRFVCATNIRHATKGYLCVRAM